MSRKELSKKLNISYVTLSKYENGERFPDIVTLINISDYFKISLDFLLDHETPSMSSEDNCFLRSFQTLSLDNKKLILELINALNQKKSRDCK